MQVEIERRLQLNQQKQRAEAAAMQRQMLEMQQQQQMQLQASMAQSQYAYANSYAPSVMGLSAGTPSVMGMPMGTPSVMGMPTGPGTPHGMVGMAYSSPNQMQQQMYQGQGYFQQPMPTPNTNMMPGGWASPSPQTPQGQYFQQQQGQMPYGHPQQPMTQPYGASFDQAQAAGRHSQQSSYSRR
jgi:CCR4-NOT transcriptional complex subunit CAF120